MSRNDARTATLEAIRTHHDQLATEVSARTQTLSDAAERQAPFDPHRAALLEFVRSEVLPHAVAEERTLYAAGAKHTSTELLIAAMTDEHRRLEQLVERLDAARTATGSAGTAEALRRLFEAHLAKENDLLLPALVTEDVDLVGMLAGMHEILGGHGEPAAESATDSATESAPAEAEGSCGCGGCGCGEASADA